MATEASDQQEKPNTSEPSAERQAELEEAYAHQQNTDAPYKGVKIRTLGELLWIFQQRNWSMEFRLPVGSQRPNLSGADLFSANLNGVSLGRTNLSGANLFLANLNGALLAGIDLSGADLRYAHLSGASLVGSDLSGTNLHSADLTKAKLNGAILDRKTALGDITWDGVNLSQINWEPVQHLGDDDTKYPEETARAYRQLATQLWSQGMSEVADRFAYLAQLWQRRIMRRRLRWTNLRSFGPYLGSLLLWAIAGYGYRPGRTFLAYLVVIAGFASGFYALGQAYGPHLSVLGAVVFSVTSFHGRGFFPGGIALDDPLTVLAAGEAIIGLLIEVTFIATFTQRFFAR